jgi:hypothetical protein
VEYLVLRFTPKLQDHPLSAVCDCLFTIIAATLPIWRPCRDKGDRHEVPIRKRDMTDWRRFRTLV